MNQKRPAPPAPEPLAPLIDAHTHLDACGATDAQSVRAIVDRAAAVGVQAVVTIADDLASARWVTDAADADPRVYAAVALHPTRANALTDEAKAVIERLAGHPRVVAIGETGMDMYWPGRLDGCAEPAEQAEAFAWHIDLAKRTGKPLMIHNRDADAQVLDVLRAEGAPETVIFHCFSSDAAMARTCVDAGWLLSLSGTVSFKKRQRAARSRPADPARAAARGNRRAVSDPAPVPRGPQRALLLALHCAGARRGCRSPCRRHCEGKYYDGRTCLWAGELPDLGLFVTVL